MTDTYSTGMRVTDPYRWLEDDKNPRVQAWADTQSALAQRFLKAQPGAAQEAARIARLARTSTTRSGLIIANGRWFYERLTPPQAQPELVVREGLSATERVLYDPVRAARGKTPAAIEAVFVAPDGAKVAFTTQQGGAEEETLHVIDVASSKMLADTLPHAGGGTSPSALAWDSGDGGFLYTRWPQGVAPAQAHFNIALYHHTLGSDPASDTYVFGRGLWRSAEYNLVTSRDGTAIAAFVEPGDGLNYAVYERNGTGAFAKVSDESTGIKDGAFIGHRLLLRSSAHNPRYEIIAVDPGQTFAQGRYWSRQLILSSMRCCPRGATFLPRRSVAAKAWYARSRATVEHFPGSHCHNISQSMAWPEMKTQAMPSFPIPRTTHPRAGCN
ncbi:MAG: hypothetical protein GIW98_06210 [Candidatus Eremiobacteraeota bacterium]|nr:hypothetical protein [Candidatus Eremiobacteraeota bacterium]